MALTEIERKITDSVEKLSKSVVTIKSQRMVSQFPIGIAPVQGAGSGLIVDSNGNVVTNYHVIEGVSNVEVILNDGRTYNGTVVGGDRATDVAIVKIDGTNLPSAMLGDSEKLKVGQMTMAIGNALDLPGAPTVSTGVVSALGRPMPWADFIFEGLIQTDAAINPGNSGGPLADLDGNVIGINNSMVAQAHGVGFAIPINTVKWVMEQIFEKGRVVRPMLGVLVANLNPIIVRRFNLSVNEGALVTNIFQGSPADRAGIKELDVIDRIGGRDVKTTKDLTMALSTMPVNKKVVVELVRSKERKKVELKLAEARTQ